MFRLILIIALVLFITYLFLLPTIKRGKTEALFIIPDGENIFLLVLMNIETFIMSKRGAIIISRYRLKKMNLQTQEVSFNIPYKRITAGLLQSYANVLGCSSKYIYLTSLKKDLTIFDIQLGKRVATKGSLESAAGVEISDQDWKFDPASGALLVVDMKGNHLAIQGTIISATSIPSTNLSQVFDVLSAPKFEEYSPIFEIKWRLNDQDPLGPCIKMVEVPGSKRSYLFVGDFFTQPTENSHVGKDSFLKPRFIKLDEEMLICHQATMDDTTDEIFISKVSFDSKEIWKLNKQQLVSKKLFHQPLQFYITQEKDRLFFTWTKLHATAFSLAVVSASTGEILVPPTYFKNKKISKQVKQ